MPHASCAVQEWDISKDGSVSFSEFVNTLPYDMRGVAQDMFEELPDLKNPNRNPNCNPNRNPNADTCRLASTIS